VIVFVHLHDYPPRPRPRRRVSAVGGRVEGALGCCCTMLHIALYEWQVRFWWLYLSTYMIIHRDRGHAVEWARSAVVSIVAWLCGCIPVSIRFVYATVADWAVIISCGRLKTFQFQCIYVGLINGLASHTYEWRVAWVVEGGLMHEWSDFIYGYVPCHGLVDKWIGISHRRVTDWLGSWRRIDAWMEWFHLLLCPVSQISRATWIIRRSQAVVWGRPPPYTADCVCFSGRVVDGIRLSVERCMNGLISSTVMHRVTD